MGRRLDPTPEDKNPIRDVARAIAESSPLTNNVPSYVRDLAKRIRAAIRKEVARDRITRQSEDRRSLDLLRRAIDENFRPPPAKQRTDRRLMRYSTSTRTALFIKPSEGAVLAALSTRFEHINDIWKRNPARCANRNGSMRAIGYGTVSVALRSLAVLGLAEREEPNGNLPRYRLNVLPRNSKKGPKP